MKDIERHETGKNMVRNVILITIDSLRADHLSCFGYHKKTTPNIDNLARSGVMFRNAISCGPDTLTSILPLLTSSYVLEHYIEYVKKMKRERGKETLRTSVEEFEAAREVIREIFRRRFTIAALMRRYGYSTAAFHSNPLLSRYYNVGGFDHFYDSLSIVNFKKYSIKRKITGILERNRRLYDFAWYVYKNIYDKLKALKIVRVGEIGKSVPYERADIINERVISWLKKRKDKFFIWIHYMDVHFPYKPPKKFQFNKIKELEMSDINYKMLTKPDDLSTREINELINLYDGEIRYVDYSIKSLLEELEEIDALEGTALILTADHGDEFGEHGDFAHHHAKLYEELIHVPLIISNTEYKNIVIDEPVSLLDIFPTILDLVGIHAKECKEEFQGKSLIPLINREGKGDERQEGERGVISESMYKGKRNVSYRTREWKIILNSIEGQYELYNLRKDPEERVNLYEVEEEKTEKLKKKIIEHLLEQKQRIREIKECEKERIKRILRAKIENI